MIFSPSFGHVYQANFRTQLEISRIVSSGLSSKNTCPAPSMSIKLQSGRSAAMSRSALPTGPLLGVRVSAVPQSSKMGHSISSKMSSGYGPASSVV